MWWCPECGNVFLNPKWDGNQQVCPECKSNEFEDCTEDYEVWLESECEEDDID